MIRRVYHADHRARIPRRLIVDRDTSFVLEARLDGLPHRIVDLGHGLGDEQREEITLGEHDGGKLEGFVFVVVTVALRVVFERSLLVTQPLNVALEGARGSSFWHPRGAYYVRKDGDARSRASRVRAAGTPHHPGFYCAKHCRTRPPVKQQPQKPRSTHMNETSVYLRGCRIA